MKKFTVSWNNKGLYYKSWWLSCTTKSERPNMKCICLKTLNSVHSLLTGSASIKFWGRDLNKIFKNSFLLKLNQPNKGGKLHIHLGWLRFFFFHLQFSRKILKLLFKVFMFSLHVLKDDRQPDSQRDRRRGGIESEEISDNPHLMAWSWSSLHEILRWKICSLSSSHTVHYTSPSQANFTLKLNNGFLWVCCLFIKSNSSCCQQQSLL